MLESCPGPIHSVSGHKLGVTTALPPAVSVLGFTRSTPAANYNCRIVGVGPGSRGKMGTRRTPERALILGVSLIPVWKPDTVPVLILGKFGSK